MTASQGDLPEMPTGSSSTPLSPPSSLDSNDDPIGSTSGNPIPEDVAQWRKSLRHHMIKRRLALSDKERRFMAQKIILGLDTIIGNVQDKVVSLYWPFQGEPDLLAWMTSIILRGAQVALPIVHEKDKPLIFKTWAPGQELEGGTWNIPVPVNGKAVTPEIVIAPLVAFDANLYRLGYGGGFFDRTLPTFAVKPLIIGVGYEMTQIASIFPQFHDVPMDLIVTDYQVHQS